MKSKLNSFLLLLVMAASVPVLVIIVQADDRDPPLRNYRVDLTYDEVRRELHYDVSFFIDRDCDVQVRDEIVGPIIDMSGTYGPTMTFRGDVHFDFHRPVRRLEPGDYHMTIFLSFWCNPLQRWANWPIVQRENSRFTVD